MRTVRQPIIPIGPSIAYLDLGGDAYALIDSQDAEVLGAFNWRLQNGRDYVTRSTVAAEGVKTKVALHHQIMGRNPGMLVDHRNRNPRDNRKGNLRWCENYQNQHNQGPREGRRFKGTKRHPTCTSYTGHIRAFGKYYEKGKFPTEEAAARWYDEMARKLHGEFAYQNFPNEVRSGND